MIPVNNTGGTQTELRRPSTLRSGNHTFEYVGFGPGNYSTGLPSVQNRVLTDEETLLAQSQKERRYCILLWFKTVMVIYLLVKKNICCYW
ncbi:MAG: hypothetical protein CM15mV22_0010 [Eurybiavirus sp.]|nr:MAG: hypothetical protein CM15mV22_0010 [Eurybiavirus sp.]